MIFFFFYDPGSLTAIFHPTYGLDLVLEMREDLSLAPKTDPQPRCIDWCGPLKLPLSYVNELR